MADITDNPVAYRHGLKIEPHDEWYYKYTESQSNPFGIPGKDYSEHAEYKCEPLWLSQQTSKSQP